MSPRPALTEGYDAVFLDLDGVVYRGDTPIPGAPEVLRSLSDAGVPKAFLTNNASRTPEQVAEALKRMGVDAAAAEVLTSAVATAELLAREGYAGSRAYAVGERGVRTALAGVGILVVDEPSAGADLVVVGWDRSVDYDKLRNASLLVERGARLVATNADASYPAPDGLWPGAGAILAAITTTTGATPTVVGKPERGMFDAAAARCGATHPLVVGDRLDTDVRGAAGAGMDSLLVLSGAASATDLLDASDLPTFLGADLRALERPLVPVRPRVAAAEDAPPIAGPLEAAGLSAAGVESRLAETTVTGPAGAPDATACLVPTGEVAILRSVAVRDGSRAGGLGTLIVTAAVQRAKASGVSGVALFTETAEPFFARLGFSPTTREALPPAVRESQHATEECAASATPMIRRIRR